MTVRDRYVVAVDPCVVIVLNNFIFVLYINNWQVNCIVGF